MIQKLERVSGSPRTKSDDKENCHDAGNVNQDESSSQQPKGDFGRHSRTSSLTNESIAEDSLATSGMSKSLRHLLSVEMLSSEVDSNVVGDAEAAEVLKKSVKIPSCLLGWKVLFMLKNMRLSNFGISILLLFMP